MLGAIVDIPQVARAQGAWMLGLLDKGKWQTTFDVNIWFHISMMLLFSIAVLLCAYLALKGVLRQR